MHRSLHNHKKCNVHRISLICCIHGLSPKLSFLGWHCPHFIPPVARPTLIHLCYYRNWSSDPNSSSLKELAKIIKCMYDTYNINVRAPYSDFPCLLAHQWAQFKAKYGSSKFNLIYYYILISLNHFNICSLSLMPLNYHRHFPLSARWLTNVHIANFNKKIFLSSRNIRNFITLQHLVLLLSFFSIWDSFMLADRSVQLSYSFSQ